MWWRNNKKYLIHLLTFIGLIIFSIIFMNVYYTFDHGLRNWRMTYLWVIPAIYLAFVSLLWLLKLDMGKEGKAFMYLGFTSVYVYFTMKAIYLMANTDSEWLFIFWLFFGGFTALSLIFGIKNIVKAKKEQ